MVAAEKMFERRHILGAKFGKAVGTLPDGIQTGEDHLGKFVDVVFPGAVVVARQQQPFAPIKQRPAHGVDRADPHQRALAGQPLRIEVDHRQHRLQLGKLFRPHHSDQSQLVL